MAEVARVFRYGHAMVRAIDIASEFGETAGAARMSEAVSLGRKTLE